MRALRVQRTLALRVLQLLILTASRTGEVIGAKRSEFDLNVRTRGSQHRAVAADAPATQPHDRPPHRIHEAAAMLEQA